MNDRGFTLLEVMVSMLIFSVVVAGMMPVFMAHLRKNSDMEVRSGAIQAAQITLDDLRLADPATLPSSGATDPEIVTVDDRDFEVTTSFCDEPTYCISAADRHIRVEVRHRGRTRFTAETIYTRLR